MISMFDSIEPGEIPAQAAAVAGYLNGDWVTAPALREHFPHAHLLTITVTASADAQALDVENGDATPGQAIPWVRRQHERGEQRPVIYANASTMPGVIGALRAAGIARGSVRLWSAHYSGPHICGPATCKYPGVPACDGTQWTENALGRNLDESLLLDDFFPEPPVTVEQWHADGHTSLAQLAGERHTGPSTVLRHTAAHGLFSAPVAHWLDAVFSGALPPSAPVPAGAVLWVPA